MILVAGLISLALLPWLAELALFRKNLLLLAWWVLIPLSIPVMLGGSKIAPSEILLLFWVATPLWQGFPKSIDKALRHPVSILLIIEIAIYALSTITSSMFAISAKRLILHSLYIVGAYFLFVPIFLERRNILKMGTMLSLGLFPVLIVGLIFMAQYQFNSEVAPAAPRPFFSDHTEFGAFAALIFPLLFVAWRYSDRMKITISYWQKGLLLALFLAISFSFSRAVWLSVAATAALYLFISWGLRFRHLLFIIILSGGFLYQYGNEIYQVVLQNEAESSRQEVLEQLKSVGNVKSDVSNLERINRWKSAIKMFEERPVLGFGPGTYQFQYAPYQELRDKTVISSNFGDAGNAHSEYLMYLSETGIFGFLTFLILSLYLVRMGFQLYRNAKNEATRYLALGILLSLTTLLVHSLFNSFLETDKIGLPFYLFAAALVGLDLKNQSETTTT